MVEHFTFVVAVTGDKYDAAPVILDQTADISAGRARVLRICYTQKRQHRARGPDHAFGHHAFDIEEKDFHTQLSLVTTVAASNTKTAVLPMSLKNLIATHITTRTALALLAAASALSLGMAFTAQYAFGLLPCILCLYQRVPFAIVILLGIAGWFAPERVRRPLLALCVPVFAACAAIAFFQVGVEQHWWQGTAACTGAIDSSDLEALRAQLLKPAVPCDVVAWSLFGISMAGYNVPFSLGLSFASLLAFLYARKTPEAGGASGVQG